MIIAGNTIILREGTYNEDLNNLPSSVTVQAYNSETVTIAPISGDFVFYTENPNMILDGLILDAININHDCVKITGPAINNRLLNCEIKNAPEQGILNGGNANGLLIDGCYIHDNGTSAQYDHGIYSGQTEVIVRNSEISNNASRGIHFYAGPAYATYQIYNNFVHDNGAQGILASYGIAEIYNNVVRNNPYGIAVMYGIIQAKVSFNTCLGHGTRGINLEIFNNDANVTIQNNAISSSGSFGIYANTSNGSIALDNNLSDGHAIADYQNAGSIIPTLNNNLLGIPYSPLTDDLAAQVIPQAGNPALGAGIFDNSILVDYGDNARGNPPTIGAWE